MSASTSGGVGVRAAFDRTAQEYDRPRSMLVPCFDDFYGALLDRLPFERDAAPQILELGAGTGLASALVRDRFPLAQLTLMDVAPKMLDQARARFGDAAAGLRYVVADFGAEPIADTYDAVISALAIHHLSHEDKRGLFARVHAALEPGGVFANADQLQGSTPELSAQYSQVWERQARARGATSADIEMARVRMREDIRAPLDDQLVWMREAGFHDVDCWYKSGWFAVYAGVK